MIPRLLQLCLIIVFYRWYWLNRSFIVLHINPLLMKESSVHEEAAAAEADYSEVRLYSVLSNSSRNRIINLIWNWMTFDK